tara:strand:+ start:387 stop:1553 length:1167 start_codon:yes stop_codon:yes gene_type:complete
MKKKVLIIFKYPHGWNRDVINKFSNYYDAEFLYVSNFENKNFVEIVKEINDLISLKKIEIVVFDPDYFKFINYFFVQKINCKKKILMTGDDFHLHELHSITASECDMVLSSDPLSVLKYKEKGFDAFFFQFDFSKIKKTGENKKDIDVLFYGHITEDRKEILNYISGEGINLKNVGHEEFVTGLPRDELLELISRSKIFLNLSKTRTSKVQKYNTDSIYKFYYQFKGKVIIAGLKGIACVSEYSPGLELLFNKDEVPTFYTKEECLEILKKLLKDEELLSGYTKNFTSKVQNLHEDKKNFESIFNAIEKESNRKVKLIKIPYWYLRIAAKQIILKNIKLSNLLKSLLQFKIIFPMLENSNVVEKILIILESFINILWYSLIYSIKNKK